MADDFAWKEGLFIPPALFKEIWLPRAQKVIAPALEAGIPIFFHSDGKCDDAMDWLIDSGFDGFNPMDPYGVDYRDYKKRYGDRITLMGNIDVEFPLVHGTPDEVDEDVKEHMDVLKAGWSLHRRFQPQCHQFCTPRELSCHAQRHPQIWRSIEHCRISRTNQRSES